MADNADSLFKQMKREHEHFLAYKFELDEKEKELNFTHKSPQEIFQQWEDQKEKARQKNDTNRREI
jgi:DNA-binding MltR family transcriptional regulator